MADDASDKNASSSSDTGYTPGEDAFTRWRNFFAGISGNMTAEGLRQYKIDADRRHANTHCRRCEKHRDYLLKYSPVIRFMSDNIRQLGGRLDADNIYCIPCTGGKQSGGFHPTIGIKLCANELRNRGHLEDTLTHEMIHAYDNLRFRVNWLGNARHQACSEIRASSLSGECRFFREWFTRGQYRVTQQHQDCVRRRAAQSLRARKDVRDDVHAARIVNEVWDSCFTDMRPFDEIYR